MPMTEIDYAPIPEIPLVVLHREKQSFTVEEVLRAGLQVILKLGLPKVLSIWFACVCKATSFKTM